MSTEAAGRPGHPRFHELLSEIAELHDKKQLDYGSNVDPFENVSASVEWGVSPWVGAMIRLNDKVHRLRRFASKGVLANESAKDSFLDIAVYALIAYILYEKQSYMTKKAEPTGCHVGKVRTRE